MIWKSESWTKDLVLYSAVSCLWIMQCKWSLYFPSVMSATLVGISNYALVSCGWESKSNHLIWRFLKSHVHTGSGFKKRVKIAKVFRVERSILRQSPALILLKWLCGSCQVAKVCVMTCLELSTICKTEKKWLYDPCTKGRRTPQETQGWQAVCALLKS